MEILLWLLPAALATVLAMAWVGWVSRSGRALDDGGRARQAERMGQALARPVPQGQTSRRERSHGVVVRRRDAA